MNIVESAAGMPLLITRGPLTFREFGPLLLTWWRGEFFKLPGLRAKIVKYLATNAGANCSYERVSTAVWGEETAKTKPAECEVNLRSLIKDVRRDFMARDLSFDEIHTVPDFGYRWGPPRPPRRDTKLCAKVSYGSCDYYPDTLQIFWRGLPVELTPVEALIVGSLLTNAGTPVSYRALYDAVWGKGFHAGKGGRGYDAGYRVNTRSLIRLIRSKFLRVDPRFDAIVNVPGRGYYWRNTSKMQTASP